MQTIATDYNRKLIYIMGTVAVIGPDEGKTITGLVRNGDIDNAYLEAVKYDVLEYQEDIGEYSIKDEYLPW